ncbi:hypothetical protein SEPCBS57363_000012 [Sporothrix epigloea]|uniref:Uncharacterized protein n=1 Tax=Sporothrix epigloea TaxID=1892477 RepID=A0ABP0D658_9PEZI
MSQHYSRRDREREINANVDNATEYAKLYQRAQRAARGSSSFTPSASPAYEFVRQRTWPGPAHSSSHTGGGSGGSYEELERGIPIRERDSWDREPYDREWHAAGSSPRTPRTAGMASSSSIGGGGGSYGRREFERERERDRDRERDRERERERERSAADSPRYSSYDPRTSPQHREKERDRQQDREWKRDKEREREQETREREREKEHERTLERERDQQERKRDRDVCRQRIRYAVQSFPRRLRTYLDPVLSNQQAMDHATDIFVKLDRDTRYLTRSVGALLESLTAVAEDHASSGNGTGLDDPPVKRINADGSTTEGSDDVTTTEESSALEDSETAAESISSESDSDDDEQQFGAFGGGGGGGGGDAPTFSSRRSSIVNSNNGAAGAGRRRSSAGQRYSGSGPDHQRKGSNSTTTWRDGTTSNSVGGGGTSNSNSSAAPALMNWAGFRPFALNKHPESVNDRRKVFLALTQIISVTLLASLGVDISGGSNGGRARLSTRGLLAELLRVLQPKDYRAYFRAAARVILLPEGGSVVSRSQPPDEMALEALERQLLGTAKFVPGVMSSSSGSSCPMMACLTYTSGSHGTITLYRLDMAPPGSATGGGSEGWPRRITPVSAMTSVPKELLRRTARSMPPSRRTVLKVLPPNDKDKEGGDKKDTKDTKDSKDTKGSKDTKVKMNSKKTKSNEKDKKDRTDKKDLDDKGTGVDGLKDKRDNAKPDSNGIAKSLRLRWISLPADTVAIPGLGYSPSVGQPALSSSFCEALSIPPDDLLIAPGTTANVVKATVPAMLAWLHARAAYLTGMEFQGTEIQRSSSGSTAAASTVGGRERENTKSSPTKDRQRDRDRDFDETASISTSATVAARGRIRRIVRWKHGPEPMEHGGREPTIVVLHPSRGDWVTAPVYWTDTKD